MGMKNLSDFSNLRHRLTFRVFLTVVLCSTLFVGLSIGLQLWLSYRNETAQIKDNVKFIERSYLPSIADSLYKLDEPLLRLLLRGALQLQGIEYCQVSEKMGEKGYTVSEGNPTKGRKDIVREFALQYETRKGERFDIGVLTVYASFEGALSQLFSQAGWSILINTLQIFITAFIVLMIFQLMVSRHLSAMAGYAKELSIENLDPVLTLKRRLVDDELGLVVDAINDLRERLKQDIEKRTQQEEELRFFHDRFSIVMDSLDAAVYVADMKTYETLFINKYVRDHFGDVVGKACWSTFQSGQTGPCPFCTNEKLLTEHGKPTGIYVWEWPRTKDGRWYECRDQAIQWTDGRMVRMEIASDITVRKQQEEELRKYEHIVSSTSDLMSFIDRDYVYQAVNEAYLKAHQKRHDEIVGRSVADLHGPDVFNEALKPELDRCLAGEEINYQKWFDYAGIGRRFVHVIYNPYHDGSGGVSGIVVNARDITDRELAEEEMRRLRNYLANIIDSMPSMLMGVDDEGRITQWNLAAQKKTGVTPEEARGRPLEEVLPWMGLEMRKVRQAIHDRSVQTEPKTPRQVAGEMRYEDVTVYPLASNGEEGAVIRVDDVTERVRIEEMMVQSEKMLSVGGLAAGMAHEINNPLGAILQAAQNVLRRVSPDLEVNRRAAEGCGTTLEALRQYLEKREILVFLEDIRESGERAAEIVSNMLSFSRKPLGNESTEDLADLLDRTIVLAASDYDLKKRYDFRRIEIVREYEPEIPPVVCQGSKIQQVFLNILRNGAEAMGEVNDPRKKPRFILRMLRDGEMVRVEIEDNGPGMDDDRRRRVFEPFYTTKDPGVGTGLGMSVSYFIVTEEHGGSLEVDSQPGVGTRFIIRLPVERI
jgi:PAS domain S-box-containing protein